LLFYTSYVNICGSFDRFYGRIPDIRTIHIPGKTEFKGYQMRRIERLGTIAVVVLCLLLLTTGFTGPIMLVSAAYRGATDMGVDWWAEFYGSAVVALAISSWIVRRIWKASH
jgi:hypothetical protein